MQFLTHLVYVVTKVGFLFAANVGRKGEIIKITEQLTTAMMNGDYDTYSYATLSSVFLKRF